MKNLPWRRIVFAIVGIAVVAAGVFYFTTSKAHRPPIQYINPAFGEYISSYTAGVVSATSTIRITLTQDAVDSSSVNKETSVRLFSFSPDVNGEARWLDRRTVEFKPDNKLISGQIYEVSFQLSKLIDVPADLKTFQYSFQIIPQNYEVTIDNIRPYVKTELKRQKIEGTFSTADFAEAADVEKTLLSKQDNKSLKIAWTHAQDGRQHHFVVEDVERREAPGKVVLSVNGDPIGIDRTMEQEVEIPSLSDFKVMQAKVVQSPNQYVVIQFSDPLKDPQVLDGLVSIDGLPSLEFDIQDNEIWIYPPVRQTGTKSVHIEPGLRNILDYRMKNSSDVEVVFEQVLPAVRFIGRGTILPSSNGMVLPFEAVNLKAVDVVITKIYENNILQFLQVNNYDGYQELYRVGKRMMKKKISLEETGVTDFGKWNRYTLDLSKLIAAEPGAIYQVKISFKKNYSTYTCEGMEGEDEVALEDGAEDMVQDESDFEGYYYEDDYYYYDDYDWEQRDNPCHNSYYTGNRTIRKNIFASDLGLIAKRGEDGNTHVFVTDIKTAQPLAGVQLELFDFYQQLLGTATTSSDGKTIIPAKVTPFALVAKLGVQRGYLKLSDADALPLSNFDVGGEMVQKGLKGFLYGERGVWRPGDSLHLTFILEDREKTLPPSHPVVFELQNPQGQVVNRLVRSSSENGFYNFATATSPDAPTGNWTGRIKVGGTEFAQTLKIETVKPNRLKINLDFGTSKFTTRSADGNLQVNWLHGAPGKNLKATFDMTIVGAPTTFPKFDGYVFEDPSREFYSETQNIFEGYTDEEGKANVHVDLSSNYTAPGFLNTIFRGKVFEESGNFSIDRFVVPYSPYRSYVGIKVPEGEQYSNILYFDKRHPVQLATLDPEGNPLSRSQLEVTLYKLGWRWWWDQSEESLANFIESSYAKVVRQETAKTVNGKGVWNLEMKSESDEYGRYFLRVCDPTSGHCSGQVIYVDEPGWYARNRGEDARGGANLLSFNTDKTTYQIGEKVNLTIPGSAQSRALVSIENGRKVIQTYWVDTQQGETKFSFEVTREMTPNVYVHVSLMQPHAQVLNDLPIRLYGVNMIGVEDPMSRLEPVIDMPDVLGPGQEVVIKVSEKERRKMTYTLAVVDEGLLDITRFQTPDAWSRFYAREALGVRTFDLFDNVIGAFGASLERFVAIGGDSELAGTEEDPRANRFKPVVKFFGPFTTDGSSKTHRFIMPQYVGSVKTMVVAGYEAAYGKAEKVASVRKPLMVLATLPRVVGPEEKVSLPVTVFASENNLRNAKIEVKTSGPLRVSGSNSQSLPVLEKGDQTIQFDLQVADVIGVGKVQVIATAGNYKAVDEIEIEIRNPNLPVARTTEKILEQKQNWSTDIVPFGVAGTNTSVLEISTLPPVNLGSRLRYLLQYPYGCIEQTTSSVFPQLFLSQIKALNEVEKNAVQRNVTAGIERLKSFVQRDGGFGYWPGPAEQSDPWSTSYAGHFLVEAQAKGYYVPDNLLSRWKRFQRNKSQEWRRNDQYYNSDLMQAYRLYTLALAGSPEVGAMNRLREQGQLSTTAAWMLAAGYARAGQVEAAKKLIANLPLAVKPYREMGYSYGSDVRDRALILETLVLLNDRTKGFEVLKEISKYLGDEGYWLSTQEIAFCLKAIGSFAGLEKRGDLKFSYVLNGKTIQASTELPIAQVTIPIQGANKTSIQVKNEGSGILFARLISEGVPARGQEEDMESSLSLSIRYMRPTGEELDVSRLEQGTEFIAEVSVQHNGIRSSLDNLALSQVFPSGWEVNNLRIQDDEQLNKNSPYSYQDIRDDRVYTFFNLYRNERRTYRVMLTAAYTGTFYLPAVTCEAMYDKSIYGRKKGMEVEVYKPVTQ